jgi:hypothetical protein
MSGARFPSIPGAADRCNFGLVGASDTVRCTLDSPVPLSTVGAGHASPADLAADRCAGGRWLTGQSGAPPDSQVNYSRAPPKSGVPDCAASWLHTGTLFQSFSFPVSST